MIPYTNASLTAITAVGTSPDYDNPGSPGTARWTGSQGIYVVEEPVETLSPGRVDEVVQTRLEIPWSVGSLVRRGDTLTFTFKGAQETGIAGTVTGDQLLGRRRVLLENR